MAKLASPVVLVHGAWHGAWCWDRVTPLLLERGIEAMAIDLPTMDVDAGYATTLHDDAKSLRTSLDALDRPALVLGHSYGGMVITEGAAGHPMVKHLIYLTAFMPDVGESVNGLMALAPNPELVAMLRVSADRRLTLDQACVGALFYGDCDEATVGWATQRLRPMLSGSNDSVDAAAWRGISSTYVVCTQDRAILPAGQREMAKRAGAIIEFEASHSPFASQPRAVVDLIERLARA